MLEIGRKLLLGFVAEPENETAHRCISGVIRHLRIERPIVLLVKVRFPFSPSGRV